MERARPVRGCSRAPRLVDGGASASRALQPHGVVQDKLSHVSFSPRTLVSWPCRGATRSSPRPAWGSSCQRPRAPLAAARSVLRQASAAAHLPHLLGCRWLACCKSCPDRSSPGGTPSGSSLVAAGGGCRSARERSAPWHGAGGPELTRGTCRWCGAGQCFGHQFLAAPCPQAGCSHPKVPEGRALGGFLLEERSRGVPGGRGRLAPACG